MKTFKVEFVSGISQQVYKTGFYHSKKAIRTASNRYDNAYGAYLSLRIYDDMGKQISIVEVK